MKIKILACFLIVFISCTNENPKSQLKVGMTYNEVEDIFGKPVNIINGFKILEDDPYAYTDKFMFADVPQNKHKRWYSYYEIKTIGHVIFSNWQYPDIIKDTFFVAYSDKTGKITTEFFQVDSIYSILFDVASNRVVDFGYYPESVTQIKN